MAFTPPLKPSFVVPPNQAKYGDYAGSTQLLEYSPPAHPHSRVQRPCLHIRPIPHERAAFRLPRALALPSPPLLCAHCTAAARRPRCVPPRWNHTFPAVPLPAVPKQLAVAPLSSCVQRVAERPLIPDRSPRRYTGHGELHVPHKCFSKTTNEEEDCGQNSRFVPALSIPYDSDGFVTMQDGTTKKWVKWLDKEIRFKHDTSATAELKGITLGDTSSLPASLDPTDSNDADDPSNAASAKYSGSWPTSAMSSSPAVVHGEVCSVTPMPKACA